MTLGQLGAFIVVGALVMVPLGAHAQDATLSGTVQDNTGGVLPGVTVTARHEAAGTTFVAVTDDRGVYRIPVRAGSYVITAELPGFTRVERPGVELLLGRQVTLNLELTVSGLAESVTVTSAAPLIDVISSNISGNIDPRQMEELPLQGRNWMDLSLLAPGSRGNAATNIPQNRQGFFQINVDGQQTTLMVCCAQNQPRFSRDAIAEFELVTNRFDATQGRTQGMMVRAVTKSGTNTLSGTFAGYFRDDSLNAKDFIQNRVIPYSNQQTSGTLGGPLVRDRVHFFVNWEYEREPNTVTFSSPYPGFNIDLQGTRTENKGGPKVDIQFTSQSRMSARYSRYRETVPYSGGGASSHPSTSFLTNRFLDQVLGDYTHVFSSNTVLQVKGGMSDFYFTNEPWAGYSTNPGRRPPGVPAIRHRDVFTGNEIPGGTPTISFSGYSIGVQRPWRVGDQYYQSRSDLTTSFDLGGRHDVKLGGEYIRYAAAQGFCNTCNGQYRSNQRPPANIEQLIPVWDDASTWNFDALSPLFTDFQIAIGNFAWKLGRNIMGAWYQDDWSVSNNLTLNLGVRWDADAYGLGQKIEYQPWLSGRRPLENVVAPRLGLNYRVDDRTVVRGGYGLFYTQLENDPMHQSHLLNEHAHLFLANDGRPNFGSNPYNGPKPTREEVFARSCDIIGRVPGCIERSVRSEVPWGDDYGASYSHMASIGVQRQLGAVMAFDSNYVFTGGRKEEGVLNANLSYDPATGTNYSFNDISRRPFPQWGLLTAEVMRNRSDYHGWESSFTRRFSSRWQASATYALAWMSDDGGNMTPLTTELVQGDIFPTRLHPLGFEVVEDMRNIYGLASGDQRHRATFNGIWELGAGFQVSGLYFFGSGDRFATSWGGDRRNQGTGGTGRLRPDGTVVPRNNFVGNPVHRVDLRLSKRQPLLGSATIDGIFEVFNLLNHENYGSYTTNESNASYGQPSFNSNVAYQPRVLQLGFRLAF